MAYQPDAPFPKGRGNAIRSKDWNDAVTEVVRLDQAKLNQTGGTVSGNLAVTGNLSSGGTISGTLAANSVGPNQLAANAVTGVKIADGAVTGGKITDGAVTNGKIADGAVTGGKIAASSVTADKIPPGSLRADKLTGQYQHLSISLTIGNGGTFRLALSNDLTGVNGVLVGASRLCPLVFFSAIGTPAANFTYSFEYQMSGGGGQTFGSHVLVLRAGTATAEVNLTVYDFYRD